MPALRDILYWVYGAWRLFRFDRGGMAYFDDRIETFWQSFFAAVPTAPCYLVYLIVGLAGRTFAAPPEEIFLIELIGYVISWTAFPLAMFYLAEAIDRRSRYLAYIAAFNWSNLIHGLLLLLISILSLLPLLPGALVDLAEFAVLLVMLGYRWFVTRVALDLPGLGAAGVVALDFVIGLIIRILMDGMIY